MLIITPVAIGLGLVFVLLCVRAIRGGQYDDLDTPPLRAVFDDED
jgi:cbb3-type cytochrome oxidase maturation protein